MLKPQENTMNIVTLLLDQTGETSGINRSYLNGRLFGTVPYDSKGSASNDIYIGSEMGTDDHFKGIIKEVMIFDSKLSEQSKINIHRYLANKWNLKVPLIVIVMASLMQQN